MLIASPSRPNFTPPADAVLVRDLVVREIATTPNLIVHVVTDRAGVFVGNINETWRGRNHDFFAVNAAGVRHTVAYRGLAQAAGALAPKAVLAC